MMKLATPKPSATDNGPTLLLETETRFVVSESFSASMKRGVPMPRPKFAGSVMSVLPLRTSSCEQSVPHAASSVRVDARIVFRVSWLPRRSCSCLDSFNCVEHLHQLLAVRLVERVQFGDLLSELVHDRRRHVANTLLDIDVCVSGHGRSAMTWVPSNRTPTPSCTLGHAWSFHTMPMTGVPCGHSRPLGVLNESGEMPNA